MMKFGRKNIIAGGIVIFIGAFGGFVLGFSVDPYFEKGFYAMTLSRFLLRAGHSHGMPFALYNLILGGLIDRLSLSEKLKKWCSTLGVLAFLMPIGLILRGLTGGAMTYAPVVLLGAIFFLSSAGLMVYGGLNRNPD
ncbi:MAG: hypothetical protein MUE70_05800 [Desulfobacterales bacterium]|jgi:hypothetical protein|nr:hypothetical protein [Desulfobacterales bacterium]